MEHERTSSPKQEKLRELPKPVFDLEQMTPEQVATLIATLGMTYEAESNEKELQCAQINELFVLVQQELENLAKRDLEKALELYNFLVKHTAGWPRELAGEFMGAELLRQLDDDNARQEVIDPWLALLDSKSEPTKVVAASFIQEVVESDWIDEPTARYLDSKLPVDDRKENWAKGGGLDGH